VLAFVAFVGVFKDVYAHPPSWANEKWKFLQVSTPLELATLALLWWYRDAFVR
jgi:hypothetical protein